MFVHELLHVFLLHLTGRWDKRPLTFHSKLRRATGKLFVHALTRVVALLIRGDVTDDQTALPVGSVESVPESETEGRNLINGMLLKNIY